MTPFAEVYGTTIWRGDCLDVLRGMPDESVHCCVTSPPYWGLRDYGTATWEGGDSACQHRVGNQVQDGKWSGAIISGVRPGVDASTCLTCGARRVDSQVGLERTPEEYVARMVAAFREVRRVLRRDGTLWLVLGDSYAGSWGNYGGQNRGKGGGQREIVVGSLPTPAWDGREGERPAASTRLPGLKPKDLVGIPWMVAFALRADGWWLRQDVVWSKPNPMPESVRDRCTRAHEYVFMLSKSRRYYYDADAIKMPAKESSIARLSQPTFDEQEGGDKDYARTGQNANRSARGTLENFRRAVFGGARKSAGYGTRLYSGRKDDGGYAEWGVNRRDVWHVASQPYREAHFATFPPALIEPCILAGCPPGGMVLDPFGGSGTVGVVASRLGRRSALIDLNADYCRMAHARVFDDEAAGRGWAEREALESLL